MKFTTKRNTIVLTIVSLLALAIGIALVPVLSIFATIIITLASVLLIYAICNIVHLIVEAVRACNLEKEDRETTVYSRYGFWKALMVLIFIGVVVIIIILLRGCGKVHMDNVVMDNVTIGNANIENADIENADIENADIENADIENADIENADIENADIENADIENADIENADIENADIENADIENAEIKEKETESTETTKPAHVCKVDESKTVTKKATCTTKGYVRKYCSCGKLISETTTKATGHSWDDGKVTKQATENSTGIKTFTCTKCGKEMHEELEKLEHVCKVANKVEAKATCTENGYSYEVCSCGKVISQTTTPATGHSYIIISQQAATSTQNGFINYYCVNCGDTYSRVIAATGSTTTPSTPSTPDEFVITISTTKVVGNQFNSVVVYTSGNASELIVEQAGSVLKVTVTDSHHLTLTVGDEDTYGKVRIYDPSHDEQVVEVRRLSPVDPRA